MPLIKLNSTLFDTIESPGFPPDPILDHGSLLNTLINGIVVSDWTPIQISSTLIRLEIEVQETPWDLPEGFQLRIEGSGIGPVSSMNALIDAINNGLATGAVSRVSILWEDVDEAGTTLREILSLTLNASGYVLSSGAQSLVLEGSLPLTFTQLYEIADLYTQVLAIESLTRAGRLALFDDLSAYGIQGLEIVDNGTTYLGLHVDATTASVTLAGLTFALTGTFPDNFGEDLRLLWEATRVYRSTGDIMAVGDFLAGEFAVSSFAVSNAAGEVLARIANPLDGSEMRWKVDGVVRDEVQLGTLWEDVLVSLDGATDSALAGLSGNDALYGLRGKDHLIGGSGRDTLNGGAGDDILQGGRDRDFLTGDTGADEFRFSRNSGRDVIEDFEIGVDHIRIEGATRMGQLSFRVDDQGVLIGFRKLEVHVLGIDPADMTDAANFLF